MDVVVAEVEVAGQSGRQLSGGGKSRLFDPIADPHLFNRSALPFVYGG